MIEYLQMQEDIHQELRRRVDGDGEDICQELWRRKDRDGEELGATGVQSQGDLK